MSLERLKLETSNSVHWLATWTTSLGITKCPPKLALHGHVTSLNFGK